MARNIAVTWDGAPNYRWKKMVAGTTWVLMCRGQKPGEVKANTGWLGIDERYWTKEGSAAAAGEWWKKRWIKAATVTDSDGRVLNLAEGVLPDEVVEATDKLKTKVAKVKRAMERLGHPGAKTLRLVHMADYDPSQTMSPDLLAAMFANVDDMTEPVTPDDKKLTFWRTQFLELKKGDGQRGAGRWDNLKRSVDRFVNSLGADATVDHVTEASYRNFYTQLMTSDSGDYFKRDTLRDAKTFINFLYQERQLNEPLRNLDSLKVQVADKAIEHFTADELRAMLKNASGPVKLFVYLFCNCGMRQKDVSTITHAMFDGKHITRKRGKNKKFKSAPTICYTLWPETIALINEHKSKGKGDDLLFVQPNGNQWVLDGKNDDGSRKRDDNFAGLWRAFVAEYPQRLDAMDVRGSAANLIVGGLSLQIMFLSDVPSGVVLKHYIQPTQPEFDKALAELRKTLHKVK